ncbi:MAG TPA: transporter substrate-binding domain-containing protein, partial [Rhodopila sp.]
MLWGGRWRVAGSALVAVGGSLFGGPPPATAQGAPPLRLCADPDNLPFSSADPATPGFYVELGGAIAGALGRPFQPVWAPTYYTKRQIRQKMLAGQCDGFVGVPDDRSFMGPRLIFSRPIIQLGYALVAPAEMAVSTPRDLHGRRVAVQYASPPQNLLASQDDVQMVTALSPEEAMQDLAGGRADAAFIWGPSAGWLNNSLMHRAYRLVPYPDAAMQWGAAIAFPRDQAELRDQVNRALGGLGGTIEALSVKYGFPAVPPPLPLRGPRADPPGTPRADPSDRGQAEPAGKPEAEPSSHARAEPVSHAQADPPSHAQAEPSDRGQAEPAGEGRVVANAATSSPVDAPAAPPGKLTTAAPVAGTAGSAPPPATVGPPGPATVGSPGAPPRTTHAAALATGSVPADVAAGHKLFNENCAHCHGPDAVQGEQRRNLRLLRERYGDEMPQMFLNTVTHGRPSKGMPNWSGIISDEEFHKILAYLASVQEP